MPLFEFKCKNCGHVFGEFSKEKIIKCEKCYRDAMRILSVPYVKGETVVKEQ